MLFCVIKLQEPENKDISTPVAENSELADDPGASEMNEIRPDASSIKTLESVAHNPNESKSVGVMNIKAEQRVLMPREVTRTLSQELGIHDDVESTDSIPTDTSSEGSKPTTPLIFNTTSGGKDGGEGSGKTVSKKAQEEEADICSENDQAKGSSSSAVLKRSLRSRSNDSSINTKLSEDSTIEGAENVESKMKSVESKEKSSATVMFAEEKGTSKSLVVDRKEFPRDLKSVKQKFEEASYKRVVWYKYIRPDKAKSL